MLEALSPEIGQERRERPSGEGIGVVFMHTVSSKKWSDRVE